MGKLKYRDLFKAKKYMDKPETKDLIKTMKAKGHTQDEISDEVMKRFKKSIGRD